MIYLYHDPPNWKAFEGELPEKPVRWDYESGGDPPVLPAYIDQGYYDALERYEKEIAALKASALVVQNPEILKGIGYLELKASGEFFQWAGTIERRMITDEGVPIARGNLYKPEGSNDLKQGTRVYILIPPNEKSKDTSMEKPNYINNEIIGGLLLDKRKLQKENEQLKDTTLYSQEVVDSYKDQLKQRDQKIQRIKEILERANDKGMFYYDAIIKEIDAFS